MRQIHRAFTLIEVLVVVGIIALLTAILIPTISYVRESGFATSTAAEIQALQGAIAAYQGTFRAYPGPLSNQAILSPGPSNTPTGLQGRPTGTENLFLALAGGITLNGAYDINSVGKGPVAVDPVSGQAKQLSPYYAGWAADIAAPDANLLGQGYSAAVAYRFRDDAGRQADDSNIPEFLDRFPARLPVLYLRAQPGAPGVCDGGLVTQYSEAQIRGYTGAQSRRLGLAPTGTQHGLLLPNPTMPLNVTTASFPMNLGDYLIDPVNPGTLKTAAAGNARVKDTYILIAAGKDRIYGTNDDITSFGSIRQ